jgi:hypothetical protein
LSLAVVAAVAVDLEDLGWAVAVVQVDIYITLLVHLQQDKHIQLQLAPVLWR